MAHRVELQDARALITGAGAGIGRATAHALAARGAHVLVTDRDGESAEKVAAEIAEQGGSATAHRLDVTDADAVAALAHDVASTHGGLEVLVCNAGVGMTGRLTEMTSDDWRWIREVNLDGVVRTCQAFGPAMLAQGRGHVAIVSSGLGYTPRATEPAYVTTKAAVLALAQCLRADWGRSGVGVSAICPGVIATDIVEHTRFIGRDATDKNRARKVFARGHRPERVAGAIVAAVEKNRAAVVPVGWEARLGWWAHRYAPVAVQQLIARQAPR
jgi:NAD(P)-dependent dehydrogenase (short-subunit alcohol dehydrogenase family)